MPTTRARESQICSCSLVRAWLTRQRQHRRRRRPKQTSSTTHQRRSPIKSDVFSSRTRNKIVFHICIASRLTELLLCLRVEHSLVKETRAIDRMTAKLMSRGQQGLTRWEEDTSEWIVSKNRAIQLSMISLILERTNRNLFSSSHDFSNQDSAADLHRQP